jgi:hypothetical protein
MIIKADYIKGYQLRVYFDDGVVRDIDLESFMLSSKYPLISKFLNINLFKKFHVDEWGLCWGDNEFDINPMSIYNGEFDINRQKIFTNKKVRKSLHTFNDEKG